MTKEEAKEQFKKLAGGLSKEQQDAIAAALENETFADEVSKGFMLNADYSRNKKELAAEKKKAEEEYADKYQELSKWAKDHSQTIEQAKKVWDDYNKYVQTYGPADGQNPNPNGNHGAPNGASLTPDQLKTILDERLQQFGGGVTSLVKDAVSLSGDYYKRYGENLPVEDLDNFLAEQRKNDPSISLKGAYKLFIEPRLEERRQTEFKEAIEKARKDEREKILSTHHIPVDNGPKEFSPAWDPKRHDIEKLSREQQEDNGRNGFMEEWVKAGQEANR